jgi:hypothetical protein
VLTLKNEHQFNFTVRLNLNNPRHRLALEKLRSSAGSYTASVVEALTKEADCSVSFPDADTLKAIMREAVSEAIRNLQGTVQKIGASDESSGKGEISDDDFVIADDFMSGLGC